MILSASRVSSHYVTPKTGIRTRMFVFLFARPPPCKKPRVISGAGFFRWARSLFCACSATVLSISSRGIITKQRRITIMLPTQNISSPARRKAGARARINDTAKLSALIQRFVPILAMLVLILLKGKDLLILMSASSAGTSKSIWPLLVTSTACFRGIWRRVHQVAVSKHKLGIYWHWIARQHERWLISYLDSHRDQPFKRYPI